MPILDEFFEEVFTSAFNTRSPDELQAELQEELDRLELVKEKAGSIDNQQVDDALASIEQAGVVGEAMNLVSAAQGDPDAVAEGDKKLLSLKAVIDRAEDALQWPHMVEAAQEEVARVKEMVDQHGDADEKNLFSQLSASVQEAIKEKQQVLLRTSVENLNQLGMRILARHPAFWIAFLERLEVSRPQMQNKAMAEELFSRAHTAVNNNDLDGLRAAARQLVSLLPADEQEEAMVRGGFGGGTIAG